MAVTGAARIVSSSDNGLRVCAASARISTTEGTALELFEDRRGDDRDRNLVKKVLSSGHKSLIEHHVFTVAFNNVSVLAEQFLIESRLASFTVKSRRYVDFERAGFYVPGSLSGPARDQYMRAVRARFDDYAALTRLHIPREDARFVLPYCFFSNFYVTCNARELMLIICSLRYGRGGAFPELRALGDQLAGQFEAYYPGVIESESAHYQGARPAPLSTHVGEPHPAAPGVELLSAPEDAPSLLKQALAFAGRYGAGDLRALTRDARARELEALVYTFKLSGVSLACITHFARHRMLSPLFEPVSSALNRGGYVLPATVRDAGGEALERYLNAFHDNAKNARALSGDAVPAELLSYLSLSGNTVELMLTLNARELVHFMKLRTCERAQWEIRALAHAMLKLLRASYPALFDGYGPSCAVDGRCPEGRLSCGRPRSACAESPGGAGIG